MIQFCTAINVRVGQLHGFLDLLIFSLMILNITSWQVVVFCFLFVTNSIHRKKQLNFYWFKMWVFGEIIFFL